MVFTENVDNGARNRWLHFRDVLEYYLIPRMVLKAIFSICVYNSTIFYTDPLLKLQGMLAIVYSISKFAVDPGKILGTMI